MTDGFRITKLIVGEELPATIEESFLVEFYAKALTGALLLDLVLDKERELEDISIEGLRMIMYGYALGQSHCDERLGEFADSEHEPNDDDTVH